MNLDEANSIVDGVIAESSNSPLQNKAQPEPMTKDDANNYLDQFFAQQKQEQDKQKAVESGMTIQSAYSLGGKQSAEDIARDNMFRDKTGLTLSQIREYDPERAELSAVLGDSPENFAEKHPAVAQALFEPTTLALAKDDKDSLISIEDVVERVKQEGGTTDWYSDNKEPYKPTAISAVTQKAVSDLLGGLVGDAINIVEIAGGHSDSLEYLTKLKKSLDSWGNDYETLSKEWNWAQRMIAGGVTSGIMMSLTYGTGFLIARGLSLARLSMPKIQKVFEHFSLGLMAASAYGQAYVEGREKGLSVGEATGHGAWQGGWEYITERLNIKNVKNLYFANKPMLSDIANFMKKEVGSEELNSFMQGFEEALALPDKNLSDFLNPLNLGQLAIETAVQTVIGAGTQTITARGLHAMVNTDSMRLGGAVVDLTKSQQNMALMQTIADYAQNSQLASQAPDQLPQIVEKVMGKDVPWAYISKEALENPQVRDAIRKANPDLVASMDKALAQGEDLAVPIKTMATLAADKPTADALYEDVRFEQNGKTVREAREQLQETAQNAQVEVDKLIAQEKATNNGKSDIEAIRKDLTTKLRQTGTVIGQTAETQAEIFVSFFNQLANRYKAEGKEKSALDLYKEYMPRILAPQNTMAQMQERTQTMKATRGLTNVLAEFDKRLASATTTDANGATKTNKWGQTKWLKERVSEITQSLPENHPVRTALEGIKAKNGEEYRNAVKSVLDYYIRTQLDIFKKDKDSKRYKAYKEAIENKRSDIAFNQEVRSQSEAVRKQYEGTEQWMKAPNGKPTNLKEEQWLAVRTPAFKAWFGDWENDPAHASKVVDENGEPLVVYHNGTFTEDGNYVANSGMHFGTKRAAEDRARSAFIDRAARDEFDTFQDDDGRWGWVDARNPEVESSDRFDTEEAAVLNGIGHFHDEVDTPELWEGVEEGDLGTTTATFLNIRNPMKTSDAVVREGWNNRQKEAETAGNDGLFYKNDYEDPGSISYVIFKSNQVKSATDNNGNYDPNDPNIFHQDVQFFENEKGWLKWLPPRTQDKSKIKGAPEWMGNDIHKFKTLRNQLMRYFSEGTAGRFWYEDSGRWVYEYTHGNIRDAEKLIELIAIYSPQMQIGANLVLAVRAFTHWKLGLPEETLKLKTGAQDKKARGVLYHDEKWDGRKTNTFYQNLMYVIATEHEQECREAGVDVESILKGQSTIDMWMKRAFGYNMDSTTDDKGTGQYAFCENTLRRLTAEVNSHLEEGEEPWTPHQVQAAIWTGIKSRYDMVKDKTDEEFLKIGLADMVPVIDKKTGEPKKRKDGTVQMSPHRKEDAESNRRQMEVWHKNALKPKTEDVTAYANENARSFAHEFERMTQVVTAEYLPSPSVEKGKDLSEASPEAKAMFTAEVDKMFTDNNAESILAKLLGVQLSYAKDSHGGYKGAVSPNILTRLLPIWWGKEGEPSREQVRKFCLAVQYITKQDAVPFFRIENRKAWIAKNRFRIADEKGEVSGKGYDTQAEAEEAAAKRTKTNGEKFHVVGGKLSRAVVFSFNTDLTQAKLDEFLGKIAAVLGEDAGFTQIRERQILVANYRDPGNGLPFKQTDEDFIAAMESIEADGLSDLGFAWIDSEYGHDHDWHDGEWVDDKGNTRIGDPTGKQILELLGVQNEGSRNDTSGSRGNDSRDAQVARDWLVHRKADYEAILERYTGSQLAEREQEAKALRAAREVTTSSKPSDTLLQRVSNLVPQGVKDALYQIAYHGSPFRFDKFSLSHIGNGEGAQAHGWGLYFALTKGIAERYRTRLGYNKADNYEHKIGDKPISEYRYDLERQAIKLGGEESKRIYEKLNLIDTYQITGIDGVEKDFATYGEEFTSKEAYDWFQKEFVPNIDETGRVFQVSIPDADVLIKERAALKDQPTYVQQKLKELFKSDDVKQLLADELIESARLDVSQKDGVFASQEEAVIYDCAEIVKNAKAEGRLLTKEELAELKEYNKELKGLSYDSVRALRLLLNSYGKSGLSMSALPDWISDPYDAVRRIAGTPKKASLLLSKFGINGLTYDGEADGSCAVIWDENAVTIIDFFQKNHDASLEAKGEGNVGAESYTAAWYSKRENTIGLNNPNLSSLAHEGGHLFLNIMFEIAKSDDAPQSIKKDVAAILDWFGIKDLQEWFDLEAKGIEAITPYHEKFARGFEAYLREGKAPSVQIETVFDKFKRWITDWYRNKPDEEVIDKAKGELTPAIRAVMDRMLATEEQIEATRKLNELASIWSKRENFPGTDAEYRAYLRITRDATLEERARLTSAYMSELAFMRERKPQMMDELAKKYDEDFTEAYLDSRTQLMEKEPLYKALERMAHPGDEMPMKVSREEVNTLPENVAKRLDALGVVDNTGLPIEVVAKHLGYAEDPVGFLKNLSLLKPLDEAAREAAESLMNEQNPDIMTAEGRDAVATAALLNDFRLRQAEKEYNIINATKKTPALLALARYDAEKTLDSMRLGDVHVGRYKFDAQRHATKALRAATKGDLERMAKAKHDEVFAMAKARKAADILERKEKLIKKASQIEIRANKMARKGLQDAEFLDQALSLLSGYGCTKNGEIRPLAQPHKPQRSFASFKEHWTAQGVPLDMIDESLFDTDGIHIDDMTVERFNALCDAVDILITQGRNVRKVKEAFGEILLENLVEKVNKEIKEANPTDKEEKEFRQGKWKTKIQSYLLNHRKMASLIYELSGFKYGELAKATLYKLNDAAAKEDTMTKEFASKWWDLVRTLDNLNEKAPIRFGNTSKMLTKAQRLAIALNTGNDGNRQRLEVDGIRASTIQQIFNTLTEDEINFVQKVWDLIDEFWEPLAEVERRTNGLEPQRVIPQGFPAYSKDGKRVMLRGGYYPIKYDYSENTEAAQHELQEYAEGLFRGAVTSSATKQGHAKNRVKETNMKLLLDLDVVGTHAQQVIHDICYRETLQEVNRLFKCEAFRDMVLRKKGSAYYTELADTLMAIAMDGSTGKPLSGVFGKALGYLRGTMSASVMGFSVTTALLQPLGIIQSMTRLGYGATLKGCLKAAQGFKECYAKSEFMRNRRATMNVEIRDVGKALTRTGHPRLDKAYQTFCNTLFGPMMLMQMPVDVPTWYAAYESALADGKSEKDAIHFADQTVEDTQGGGHVQSMSRVHRDYPLATMFYSYFSATYQLLAESANKNKGKGIIGATVFTRDLVMMLAVPNIVTAIIYGMARGTEPPEDEGKFILSMLAKFGSAALGMFAGLREVTPILEAVFGEFANYQGPAFARIIPDATRLVQAMEGDKDAYDKFLATLPVVGDLTGLPTTQLQRSLKGAKAYSEGETDMPTAILFGKPTKGF